VQLLGVKGQRGTTGDLIPVIEQIGTDMPDMAQAAIDSALAIAYVEERRLEDAHRVLAKFADGGFELPPDSVWLLSIATYADVAIACRDREMAGPLFDLLAPFAGQLSTNGGATVDGPVSHFLASLHRARRYDDAASYFSEAAVFNERAGATYFAAQTDLLWGQMLAERGAADDIEKARTLLERACTLATTTGTGHRVALDASAPRSR